MLWGHLQHWIYKVLSISVNFKIFKADFMWGTLKLLRFHSELKDKCEQLTLNVCVNVYVNYSKNSLNFTSSAVISMVISAIR